MINFINITKKKFLSTRLYRFSTIYKIKESLIDRMMYISKPEKWNDPYERYFLNAKYIINGGKGYLPIKGRVFSLCFTERYNSEAFWKTYAPKEDGIRLIINTRNLMNKLEKIRNTDIYIGKVEYLNTNSLSNVYKKDEQRLYVDPRRLKIEIEKAIIGKEQLKLLLFKRKAFLFEEEIRIFFIPRTKSSYFSLNINMDDIVKKFYLDPRLTIKECILLREEFIMHYKINKTKIGRSYLYVRPRMKKFDIDKKIKVLTNKKIN